MYLKTLNTESLSREKRIVKRLNLQKLPFKIGVNDFCSMYIDMMQELRQSFKYQNDKPGMAWCLSTIKRFKVFLLIFEANEIGNEIYKESLSANLPEYSYKTIAQIVDEGVVKNFFIKLAPRIKKTKDLKIRNIRPSEEIIVGFINWKIDMLSSLIEFKKKI